MQITLKGWSRLNRFLLEAGSLESVADINSWVINNISSIVPYDNSAIDIALSEKLQPSITLSLNSDKKWEDLFNSYYYTLSLFPEFNDNVFSADNRKIEKSHKSEYYNDFLAPQRIRYTAGFTLYDSENKPSNTLVVNRTSRGGMFSTEELSLMKAAAQHLSNYRKMLLISERFKKIPVMLSELEEGNSILSPRETEIVYLLAKRLKPVEIAKELKISLLTVRKHIQNIYEKLNISDRHGLLMRIHQCKNGI